MFHWSVYDHPLSRDGVHLLWNSRTDQLIRLSDADGLLCLQPGRLHHPP